MNSDDLNCLLSLPREDERLEFKEAGEQFDTAKLMKYCVGIANEGGGHFILGVSNQTPRKVVGTRAFPNPAKIQNMIFTKLRFRVDVEEITHPDGRILVFHIPSRPVGSAYQFEGAYLMRSTEDLIPMTEDQLRRIFDEGKPDWLSELAKTEVTGAEVIALLDTQSYFDMRNLPYPKNRDSVIDRLVQERLIVSCAVGYGITNLGTILFAKNLSDFDLLARKAPRVIVYDGTSKLKTRQDKVGTKGYAVAFEGLIDFLFGLVPRNEVIEHALRRKVEMFPEVAIRELVANALIHQDFSETGTSIMIELYSDRLDISSPGEPFIPTERFIDGHQSRNERLAHLMRQLGICEEKGSGIDRVIDSVEVFQLPAPDFHVGERRTHAILFAHKDFDEMDRNERLRACYQHCCLRYVMNKKMSNQSLRERFRLSGSKAASVSQIISEAVRADAIKPDDTATTSRRYAKYVPFWA